MQTNLIQNDQEDQRIQENKVQQRQREDTQTLDTLQDRLKIDSRNQSFVEDKNRQVRQEDIQKDTEQLRRIATENLKPQNNIRPENETKTILNEAIRESEQMLKLSKDAMQTRPQTFTKQLQDIAQLSFTETTPNTRAGNFIEQYAVVAQAIEEQEKYRFKTTRISEEVAIRNQTHSDKQEKDQVQINNQEIKKPQEKNKLNLSMDMNYGNSNQESKGKALIEEKRQELIEKQKTKLQLAPEPVQQPHPETPKQPPQQSQPAPQKNKLRAKFNGNHHYF